MDSTREETREYWQDRLRRSRSELPDKKPSAATPPAGLAGLILQRQSRDSAFESDGLISFLGQLPPRQIPVSLKAEFKGDAFPRIWGVLAGLAGLLIFVLSLVFEFPSEDGADAPWWVLTLMGALIMAVGWGIFGCCRYLEKRRYALLRNGLVIDGTITELSPSPFVTGNERVFNVCFQATDGTLIKTKIHGLATNRADELKNENANTPALQDPHNSQRIILIECYTHQ